MVKVAIVGGSGYTGAELVRWVAGHPHLELCMVMSDSEAGRRVADVYPALAGVTDAVFSQVDVGRVADEAGLVFLAVPHSASMAMVPALYQRGLVVIDLSADFRLADPAVYAAWYGVDHQAPDLLCEAVYGLPELDRTRLPAARLVAVPGCYPTATALAAAPVLETGLWDGRAVHVDAKSGLSGAGRSCTPSTHFVAANESLTPYKVAAHRHTPEIEQTLSRAAGARVQTLFVPHLVPLSRGLLSTVYVGLHEPLSTSDAVELYRSRFAGEPFVRVLEPGVMPSTAEVRGTNRAVIGLTVDARTSTLVAVCAIDNLGKGASGQAVQCANAVLGMPETDGLTAAGAVV